MKIESILRHTSPEQLPVTCSQITAGEAKAFRDSYSASNTIEIFNDSDLVSELKDVQTK